MQAVNFVGESAINDSSRIQKYMFRMGLQIRVLISFSSLIQRLFERPLEDSLPGSIRSHLPKLSYNTIAFRTHHFRVSLKFESH